MTNPEQISIGIAVNSRGAPLRIVAPTDVLKQAEQENPFRRIGRGWNKNFSAEKEPPEAGMQAWRLNEGGLGKVHPITRKQTAQAINGFIGSLINVGEKQGLPMNPAFDLRTFRPAEDGFRFHARIPRPADNSPVDEIKDFTARSVAALANNLFDQNSRESYLMEDQYSIANDIGYGPVAVSYSMGALAGVKTHSRGDAGSDSLDLRGHNIESDRQALTLLKFGAALGCAVEALDQPS